MNLRKIILLLLLLLLLPFALKVKGQDFGKGQSLFTDIKAHKVGDILTVLIYESSQATNQIQTKTEKTSDATAAGGPNSGPIFKLIPSFGLNSSTKNNFDGKGENLRNGSLKARISVTVVAVKDNGDLVVEGSRVVGISKDRETISLSGVVRQQDIAPDNTVNSFQIADADIQYTGKGNADTGSRPGFFSRILGWLF
jgi:flagellar L-ring protein precursor FlgH